MSASRRLGVLLLVGATVLHGCATPRRSSRSTESSQHPVAVPGLPVVVARITPGGLVAFLLDTGSTITVLDFQEARRRHLPVFPYAEPRTGRGMMGTFPVTAYSELEEIRIGATVVHRLFPPLLDLEDVGFGILGTDALKDTTFLVDLAAGHVTFLEPSEVEKRLLETCPGVTWIKLALTWREGLPFVRARVGDVEIDLILDTGSSRTVLAGDIVDALRPTRARVAPWRIHAIGGTLEYEDIYRIRRFTLGDRHRELIVGRHKKISALGLDALGPAPFVIDLRDSTLWLARDDGVSRTLRIVSSSPPDVSSGEL